MHPRSWTLLYCSAFAAALLVAAPSHAAATKAATPASDVASTTTSATDTSTTTLAGGSGDDSDDDGVSDGEDNCPGVADASQDDLDGDGVGDVCDSSDATLDDDAVVKVAPATTTGTGGLTGKGTFVTTGADDDSVDDASDLTVEVTDSDSMDETVTVSSDDCGETEDGSVSCASPTASLKLKKAKNGTYRYTVRLRHLKTTTAPVPPLTLRVQHGAHRTDRVGQLATCVPKGHKSVCTSH